MNFMVKILDRKIYFNLKFPYVDKTTPIKPKNRNV